MGHYIWGVKIHPIGYSRDSVAGAPKECNVTPHFLQCMVVQNG